MKGVFNQSVFYLILMALCSLNGTLYTTGTPLARGLYILLVFVSVYYAIKVNSKYKVSIYFRALNVFVAFLSIYGVAVLFSGGGQYGNRYVTNTSFLFNIYNSLLPVYAFYYFTKEGLLKEKNMKFWFFVFFLLAINSYYQELFEQRILLQSRKTEFESLTNNASYLFLGLIPAVFYFNKKPILQYALLIVSGFFILSSVKRGAILIFAICLLWFIFRGTNNQSTGKRSRTLILSALIIAAGYYFITKMMASNAFFISRMDQTMEGDDSGRSILFTQFLDHLKNETNLLLLLFGNGADGTLKIAGQYAHNDWLELGIDMGVVGIVIYIVYWVNYYKEWKSYKRFYDVYSCIGMLIIIYFAMTFFSMSFSAVSYGSSFILGYSLATGYLLTKNQQSV